MKIISENDKYFRIKFRNIINSRSFKISKKIDLKVKDILDQVKMNGDKALIKLTHKYDNNKIKIGEILVNKKTINEFSKKVEPEVLKSFKKAIQRINKFHKKQYPKNYYIKSRGIKLSSRWLPLNSIGIYVPGGLAAYPSTLIMNIVPALLAGVKRVVVVTPCKEGNFNPYIMALIKLFNVNEIYQIGGAQAIAALAFGTKTIKSVDKIFGPGNAYVTSAKKQIFGIVGIDLIAGPSEILIIGDKSSNAKWIASDLIAQAEHDELAQTILITDSKKLAKKVQNNIIDFYSKLKKIKTIKKSLNKFGKIIILNSLKDVEIFINEIAPEHLHLHTKNSEKIYTKVTNVGSVFINPYTTTVFGDYILGPNHTLPTNGSAKFSSGLNVIDFMRRTSCAKVDKKGFNLIAKDAKIMAEVEGLLAHKLSIQIREE